MTAPAPSSAEQATIARFGIFEAEERVEKVARAIFDAANPIVESFPDYWERVRGGEETRDHYRRLAVAALAALPASPACAGGRSNCVLRVTSAEDPTFDLSAVLASQADR